MISVVAIHVVAIPVVVIPVVIKALAEIEEALSARSAQHRRRRDRGGVPRSEMLSTGAAEIGEEFPGLKCSAQASHRSMRSSRSEMRPAGIAKIDEEFPV